MIHRTGLAHGVQMTAAGLLAAPRGLASLVQEWRGLITWRIRGAIRASGREQKVALLGLALVLAVLTWP